MPAEEDVRKASENFYAALNRMGNGEKDAMAGGWVHSAAVTAMHPIGGRTVGWDAVRDSFDQVASMATDATIGLRDQFIQVHGDIAYELGVEVGEFKMAGQKVSLEHRVTNIYACEEGSWKLIHHHTDTSAGMLDVLSRLQPPAA
jgi:ketosteroid isomerase-like protein